jgi:hypothetical protein
LAQQICHRRLINRSRTGALRRDLRTAASPWSVDKPRQGALPSVAFAEKFAVGANGQSPGFVGGETGSVWPQLWI